MFSIAHIITTTGYLGIFFILFFETALPVCFFFPGDSLLFVAGFYISTGRLLLGSTLVVSIVASLLGGILGYFLGELIGEKLFTGKHGKIVSEKNRITAERFYKRFGVLAVMGGKFIPIVRSFIASLAGIGKMPAKRFHFANTIGAIIWPVAVVMIGIYVGRRFPWFEHFVPLLFTFVIVGSIVPIVWKRVSLWRKNKQI